jgi:hypothetical protein
VFGQCLHPLAGGNTQYGAGAADLIPRERLAARNTLQDLNIVCLHIQTLRVATTHGTPSDQLQGVVQA